MVLGIHAGLFIPPFAPMLVMAEMPDFTFDTGTIAVGICSFGRSVK